MSDVEKNNFVSDALLFVTVIDCNSFTKAADKLNMSKSVVSKRISRLESYLELQLLRRSTRKLSVTDAGKNLYDCFSVLKGDIQNIENRLSQHKENPSGLVQIHSPVSFGNKALVPMIKSFSALYPQIETKVFLGKRFGDVIESGMDLSIHVGPLKDSNLFVKKLFSSPLTVCASPEYLESQGYPLAPKDLLDHNCLRYHSPSIGNDWMFKVDGEYEVIHVTGNFSASNANTLEEAALVGQGLVLLPEYVVKRELVSGRLIRVLSEFSSSSVEISALYSEREHLAPKVKVLLDFLVDYFSSSYAKVN
jgi:DNA-binding transcriptional LysR family regulator